MKFYSTSGGKQTSDSDDSINKHIKNKLEHKPNKNLGLKDSIGMIWQDKKQNKANLEFSQKDLEVNENLESLKNSILEK